MTLLPREPLGEDRTLGWEALPTRARVQVHRFWSVLALHEWVPRVMDYRSPALFTREEISHMRIWSAG